MKIIIAGFIFFSVFFTDASYVRGAGFDHDHIDFTKLLKESTIKKYGQTWVQYSLIKKDYYPKLRRYLEGLSKVSESDYRSFSSNQKLAYLINAYNAFTIEWILRHFPVKSIKDTTHFLTTPWKKEITGFKLFGKPFTLDWIEHEKIRKEFLEPRIHFAVNCASIGCPSLRQSAYTAKKLDTELAEAERDFFMNPSKFKVVGKKVFINSIFDWYGEDFIKKFGSLSKYISVRAKIYGISKQISPENLSLEFIDYDWSLNGN